MRTETLYYETMVDEETAWADDRVPSGVFDVAVPAPEAKTEGNKADAWFFFTRVSIEEEEQMDREEHHGARNRACRRAGFDF